MKEISRADFMPIDGSMSRTLSVVNGFSCVFGSLGNLALIAIILLHKQLHGASEILLMSLALADFVACGVYLPLLLVRLNTNEKLPTTMNQSRRAIGQAAVVCVSLNLLMLTVDRLIFFYRPLRYTHWMRKRVLIMIITIIYGISLIVGFYAYYDMIKSQYPKIALVGVPMLIFFMLHYAIGRLAAAHRNQVANQEQSLQHNYSVTSSAMVQARRNVRTVILFGILYLLTWLPVTIFQLWRSVTNYHDPKSFQKYFYLLLTIQQISACIDPYFCCYRNNKVKAVLKKLMPIRKWGLGSSPANTASMSLSDGLDSNSGKGHRNLVGVGKAAVVSGSLENMLRTKDLEQAVGNSNSADSLDRIISVSGVERASPNEYESFENINKFRSLERTIANRNGDANLDRNTADVSSKEQSGLTVSDSSENVYKIEVLEQSVGKTNRDGDSVDGNLNKIKNLSNVEQPVLTVCENLENMNIPNVLEETVSCTNSDIIDSDLNKSTAVSSGTEHLTATEGLPKMNKDRSQNMKEIDLITSDEVASNLGETNELSIIEQSEEKRSPEQSSGLAQSLEQSSGLEQSLEQSLRLEQSLEQQVRSSHLADKMLLEHSVVLNLPGSVDVYTTYIV